MFAARAEAAASCPAAGNEAIKVSNTGPIFLLTRGSEIRIDCLTSTRFPHFHVHNTYWGLKLLDSAQVLVSLQHKEKEPGNSAAQVAMLLYIFPYLGQQMVLKAKGRITYQDFRLLSCFCWDSQKQRF